MYRRASLVGLCLVTLLCGAAHAMPLSIDAFFVPPVSRGAQLSPSGHYLALIEHAGVGDRVTVIDLETHETTTAMAARARREIDWIRWKGDGRLLASTTLISEPSSGGPMTGSGQALVAMGRNGEGPLALSAGAIKQVGPGEVRIADPLNRDPGHVLVAAPDAHGAQSLWKVDVSSGATEFVKRGDGDPDDRLPGGAMVVRYDHKDAGRQGDQKDAGGADFEVLGPAQGGHTAYVALQPRTRADGDTVTVRVYDFDHKTLSDPVWPALNYDVSDVVYHEGDLGLAGVCYTADAYTCDLKDPELQADYQKARAVFHGERNLTPLAMSDDARYWLFGVSGPTEPGAYYVFDRHTKKLTLAANRQPGLPAAKLGLMRPFVYKARDGTEIPGYLTRPPGAAAGPLPLIVMPHGGPEARDAYGFDTWGQILATRGYLVFQPNFRGSSGYGRHFAEAGYRQWGGRMQDDLTDGVQELIRSGQADPARVCIFGASYGGYAALYGGAQSPELYKCVASFAGVSDLRALVGWEHHTKGHEARFRYAERAIGDPVRDARKLAATSPIGFAANYRPPVLLIHGSKDVSVPIQQSQDMARALTRAGKDVRLMVFDGEGHADWSPPDEEAALKAVSSFITSHIAPAPPAS